jgi:thioredoxin-dependent peroxiredoxin
MTARIPAFAACVAALSVALAVSAAPAISAAADTASPAPTPAMVSVGAAAPAVIGASTFAGKIEQFDLSKALANGAVVLYFFPKAFTSG